MLAGLFIAGSLDPRHESLNARMKGAASLMAFDTIKTNLRDYIWPTDASTKITSTFAEYRATHFHGGIDISTNGQTGYNVYAVRDGYVCRVRIFANDYGKMLYIRHPDGYYSTYAHLKGFSGDITKVVKQEQYKKGCYTIDLLLEPNQLPVHKGDVVAFTGESGVGPPHLHFELRDENLNPINPLLCKTYSMQDNIPPNILRLMISPLNPLSTVDNSQSTRYFSRFPGRREAKRLPQTINIQGEIGFGVDAIDRSNGSATKSGIHRMEFSIDDSTIFTMQLDRVPNDDTKEIDLDYDLPSINAGAGKFQKLYIDAGNSLPFYDHRPEGTGIINTAALREGMHNFAIDCFDFAGNRAKLTGRISVAHKPIIQLVNVSDNAINVEGNLLASISKFVVLGKRISESHWNQHTLAQGRFQATSDGMLLPVNSDKYDMLKILAETETGVQTTPLFYFKKKPNGAHADASLSIVPERDFTRLTLTTKGIFTAMPDVKVKEGFATRAIHLQPVDLNRYTGVYIPSDTYEGERSINVTVEVNGHKEETSKSIELFSIPTGKPGSFSFEQGEMLVSYDSGAVFKPLYMRISRDYEGGTPIYVLEPQDVLLDRGITVSLPDNPNARKKHLGLYFRGTHGWVFQTDKLDNNRAFFSTTISRTLGEFAVFGDDVPPTVGRLRMFPGKEKVSGSFRYGDNRSGVDPEQLKVYIDGSMVIPEIDGEHSRAYFMNDTPLPSGKHKLLISVRDRAKNESTLERIFKTR